jgi:biopolymer transport protein ExbD
MSVGGRDLTFDQLELMLLSTRLDNQRQEPELRFRADRTVPYRDVEPLLLGAARAAITRVRFSVLPER